MCEGHPHEVLCRPFTVTLAHLLVPCWGRLRWALAIVLGDAAKAAFLVVEQSHQP